MKNMYNTHCRKSEEKAILVADVVQKDFFKVAFAMFYCRKIIESLSILCTMLSSFRVLYVFRQVSSTL